MIDTMGIYITSSGRSDKLDTLKSIPTRWADRVNIVVKEEEFVTYYDIFGDAVEVIKTPPGIKLMSPKRQWAIENSPYRYFMMLDDDLHFHKRIDGKLIRIESDEVGNMLDMVVDDLQSGTPFVGISSRAGNNHITSDYEECTRVSRCWAFDRKIYMELGINIAPFPDYVIDDFHVILSFLEAGYKNRVYYNYAQSDKGSNSEGGCSSYRNFEVQRKSAVWLHSQHPHSVEVVKKVTKQSWKGMQERGGKIERIDINVQWKKAFKMKAKVKSKSIMDF